MNDAPATTLVPRMMAAARWDRPTYESVKADGGATKQAAIVLAINFLAFTIATGAYSATALAGNLVMTYASWVILAFFVGWIGVKLFKGQATTGELLRTTGFAYSAGVLMLIGLLPVVGGFLRLVVSVVIGFTVLYAIKTTLGISAVKAFFTLFLAIFPWGAAVVILLRLLPL